MVGMFKNQFTVTPFESLRRDVVKKQLGIKPKLLWSVVENKEGLWEKDDLNCGTNIYKKN